MQIEQNSLQDKARYENDSYIFKRKDGRWYIELFFYSEKGLIKREFELEESTDRLLNTIAHGRNRVRVYFSVEPLGGSDLLELLQCCTPPDSGGIYRYKTASKENAQTFWICDLALIVFADIPERIYIKRLPLEEPETSENEDRFS